MLSKENTMRFTPGTISSAWTRERYIVSAGPNPLSLRPDHSGRTGVLAERENPLRGDLRVSVLAALRFDEGAGNSELALARAAGGSRAQIRNALENLEMTGRVRRLSALSKTKPVGTHGGAGIGARNHNATHIDLLRFG